MKENLNHYKLTCSSLKSFKHKRGLFLNYSQQQHLKLKINDNKEQGQRYSSYLFVEGEALKSGLVTSPAHRPKSFRAEFILCESKFDSLAHIGVSQHFSTLIKVSKDDKQINQNRKKKTIAIAQATTNLKLGSLVQGVKNQP